MIEVAVPGRVGAEHAAWHIVLDLADADLPRWVLAGGLMVHLHMSLDPPNTDGVGHRFTRDDGAVVDVLAADFGERARPHTTIPPARTVKVPDGRGLLAARFVATSGRLQAPLRSPACRSAAAGVAGLRTNVPPRCRGPDAPTVR